MDLDAITNEDIFGGIQSQCKKFDDYMLNIDTVIRKSDGEKLKHFVLVKPFELTSQIDIGNYVRFIKKKTFKISCVCVVKEIVYVTASKRSIKKILLSPLKYNNIFIIYPYNHYIYKKDMNIFDQAKVQKLEELYAEKKNVKMISISQENKAKLCDTYFGDKFGSMLDSNIDKIFEMNDKRKRIVDTVLEDDSFVDKLLENANFRKSTLRKIKKIENIQKTYKNKDIDSE